MNPVTLTNPAREIERLHGLARSHADQAVQHATQAGKLLLQVKAELGHGKFLVWIDENLTVTARQAQRYIAAAQGKATPILAAAKPTSMSHLSGASTENGWTPRPAFVPERGTWYWQLSGARKPQFVVEPAVVNPGFWFVSKIHPGGDEYDCTARPIAAAWVESYLVSLGLANPRASEWLKQPSEGVRIALETLNSPETTEARLARKETIEEAIARMRQSNERGCGHEHH